MANSQYYLVSLWRKLVSVATHQCAALTCRAVCRHVDISAVASFKLRSVDVRLGRMKHPRMLSVWGCRILVTKGGPSRYAYGWTQSCKCAPRYFWLLVVAASYPCIESVAFCASYRTCFVLPSPVRCNFRWGRMKSIGACCCTLVICSTSRSRQSRIKG